VVLKVDSPAEICLFGSVAGNRYDYSSDIDVLVVYEVDRLKSLSVGGRRPSEGVWDICGKT
jgi:predicted nucleotidyltransferase